MVTRHIVRCALGTFAVGLGAVVGLLATVAYLEHSIRRDRYR
jgi:hypothetical protein